MNKIAIVIQNKNDIRKLMADKKTKESSCKCLSKGRVTVKKRFQNYYRFLVSIFSGNNFLLLTVNDFMFQTSSQ